MCQKLKESNGLASAGPTLTQTSASGNVALFQQEIARLNGLLQDKMMECDRFSRERDDSKRRDQERIQMLEQQVFISSNSEFFLNRKSLFFVLQQRREVVLFGFLPINQVPSLFPCRFWHILRISNPRGQTENVLRVKSWTFKMKLRDYNCKYAHRQVSLEKPQ